MEDFEGIRERSDGEERSDHFHVGNLDRIKDAPPNAGRRCIALTR